MSDLRKNLASAARAYSLEIERVVFDERPVIHLALGDEQVSPEIPFGSFLKIPPFYQDRDIRPGELSIRASISRHSLFLKKSSVQTIQLAQKHEEAIRNQDLGIVALFSNVLDAFTKQVAQYEKRIQPRYQQMEAVVQAWMMLAQKDLRVPPKLHDKWVSNQHAYKMDRSSFSRAWRRAHANGIAIKKPFMYGLEEYTWMLDQLVEKYGRLQVLFFEAGQLFGLLCWGMDEAELRVQLQVLFNEFPPHDENLAADDIMHSSGLALCHHNKMINAHFDEVMALEARRAAVELLLHKSCLGKVDGIGEEDSVNMNLPFKGDQRILLPGKFRTTAKWHPFGRFIIDQNTMLISRVSSADKRAELIASKLLEVFADALDERGLDPEDFGRLQLHRVREAYNRGDFDD